MAAIKRRKRRDRDREGESAITTGRDEAVASVVGFARKCLLRDPEVRERLGRIAELRGADRWRAIEYVAGDYEGVLDLPSLARLPSDWPRYLTRINEGWQVVAVTLVTRRPGTESSLAPDRIELACSALALRPRARAELNNERDRGLRVGSHRQQLGHRHGADMHAQGTRADELAAAGASSGRRMTEAQRQREVQRVEKARRDCELW